MNYPTPPFIHYLQQLRLLVTDKVGSVSLLDARLHEDMFPLHQQISTAISFSLRCCCALAGREVVSFNTAEASLKGLLREIDLTLDYLASFTDTDFAGCEMREIAFEAGFARRSLTGSNFFSLYAFPNFLFHFSMAYAILRERGQSVSKGDFDGFHQYPAGFSFEATIDCTS